jgi:hypothetical protein
MSAKLFDACRDGDLNEAKRLIDAGVDVNSKNQRGKTPFQLACKNGHVELARLLVDNGAKKPYLSRGFWLKKTHQNKKNYDDIIEVVDKYNPTPSSTPVISLLHLSSEPARVSKRLGGKTKQYRKTTQKRKVKTHKEKMNRLRVKSRSTKPRR